MKRTAPTSTTATIDTRIQTSLHLDISAPAAGCTGGQIPGQNPRQSIEQSTAQNTHKNYSDLSAGVKYRATVRTPVGILLIPGQLLQQTRYQLSRLTVSHPEVCSAPVVKACVLFAAGTNCDGETVHALELAGASPATVHVNRLKERPRLLRDYQFLVIPGGFSYGDYISSGRILAGEVERYLAEEIRDFHAAGKPILGICNGFQVLVKSGLLPAVEELFAPQTVTLDWNENGRFEDRWVNLKTEPSPCIFTRDLNPICHLPVAHAEGRFITRDARTLAQLKNGNQVVFRYATGDGEPIGYPGNPNGSVDGIAAICDPSGLIMGMMPHPERYVRREQYQHWHRERASRPQGIKLFKNAVAHAEASL